MDIGEEERILHIEPEPLEAPDSVPGPEPIEEPLPIPAR